MLAVCNRRSLLQLDDMSGLLRMAEQTQRSLHASVGSAVFVGNITCNYKYRHDILSL